VLGIDGTAGFVCIDTAAAMNPEKTGGSGAAGFASDGDGVRVPAHRGEPVIRAAFMARTGLNLLRGDAGVEVPRAGFIRESQIAIDATVEEGGPVVSDRAVESATGSGETIFEAAVGEVWRK